MKRWALSLALPLFLSFSPAGRSADFNGDGTGDVAAFRASTGLWSVQGITRMYLGSAGDIPVPGDYSGNGTDQAAIFRPSTGMWSVRDVTRVYLGNSEDEARPGDYDGDRIFDIAIFRPSTGMWSVRNVTRTYFGGSEDVPIGAGTVKAPHRILSANGGDQPAGFYDEINLTQIDRDLVPENIIRNVTIFGVQGDFECN